MNMKKILPVIFVLAAALTCVILNKQHSKPIAAITEQKSAPAIAPALPPAAEAPRVEVAVVPEAPPSEIAAAASTQAAQEVAMPEEKKEPRVVNVPAYATLAMVNGTPLTLKDLVPLPAADDGMSVSMESDEYRARLRDAINTELTYQAARKGGIELTEEQKAVVDSIRARKQADIEEYRKQGILWTSVTEEQVAFQQRRVAALLLQKNLMSANGMADVQITDDDITDYYQTHAAEFSPMPSDPLLKESAWANLKGQIGVKLLGLAREQETLANEQFLDDLRAGAAIQEHPLPELSPVR